MKVVVFSVTSGHFYKSFLVSSGKAAVFRGTAAKINLTFIKVCITFHTQMNNTAVHLLML